MKGQQQQLDMDKWIEKGDVLIEALRKLYEKRNSGHYTS